MVIIVTLSQWLRKVSADAGQFRYLFS